MIEVVDALRWCFCIARPRISVVGAGVPQRQRPRPYCSGHPSYGARVGSDPPINAPVCSPQSNGMAESFVNTFRRDYVVRMDLKGAKRCWHSLMRRSSITTQCTRTRRRVCSSRVGSDSNDLPPRTRS